jgi:hypothetical protein
MARSKASEQLCGIYQLDDKPEGKHDHIPCGTYKGDYNLHSGASSENRTVDKVQLHRRLGDSDRP